MSGVPDFGALVISLDFELHWGVRDHEPPDGPYRANLLGVRAAVPRILDLFDEYGVNATWATVGFLFARSREELERHRPRILPRYENPALDPYCEPLGECEADDPLHFAPSLIDAIRTRRGQEIGTHTFSHFLCCEPGQDRAAFREDLRSARAIAARSGIELRSIVFPRNQVNPAYTGELVSAGIDCYRGNAPQRMFRPRRGRAARAQRLLDAHVGRDGHLSRWQDVCRPDGTHDVAASFFLRPWSPRWRRFDLLRRDRLRRALREAAHRGEILHLWWHPHNFGVHLEENVAFLREILDEMAGHRERGDLRSLSMAGVADALGGRD